MIYLIIRKYQFKDNEPNYRIEKWANTIKEANQFLSASFINISFSFIL